MNDREKKAKSYWRYKYSLRLSDFLILYLFLLVIQFTGVSSHLKFASQSAAGNFYFSAFIYLLILTLAYYVVAFPLNLLESYILERTFDLSNETFPTWIKNEFKKTCIALVIFLTSVEIFYAVSRNFPKIWWIVSAMLWIGFSIIFTNLFPVIILPLFFKYNTLTDKELRNKVLGLAKRFGVKVLDAFEINLSKYTKKSNAALVGWGDTRRIILADNLLKEFTPQEIEVVVAHEIAHYKFKHIWKLISINGAFIIFFFYIFNLISSDFARIFGASTPFDIVIFPAIWAFFVLFSAITSPFQNAISRKLEKDADMAALSITRLNDSFISLMERLAEKNLSDKNPNRLIELIFYNHPPISKRIALAKKI